MRCRRCRNFKSKVVKTDTRYNIKIRTRVCLRCDNVFHTIESYFNNSPERIKGGELPFKKRK